MMLPTSMPLVIFVLMLLSGLIGGCQQDAQLPALIPSPNSPVAPIANTLSSKSATPITSDLLPQSWAAYRQRFIQADGRVIDWEVEGRSTSEGQAYAMLRAVVIDDPQTFARTLEWAEKNLQRQTAGKKSDNLWAWKWGRDAAQKWSILDNNFASDADIDAATALILAARRWNRPDYLNLAMVKLQDLWNLSTVSVGNQRLLLPGPKEAFQKPDKIKLNPSYLAPYAFRLFAQVDSTHDWLSLANSSYHILESSAKLSTVDLPSDWVALDPRSGRYEALTQPSPVLSQYGFDAYRVWWRVALDAEWFNAPQAHNYLQRHSGYLRQLWRSQQKVPAQIDLAGKPLVAYEATSQYGMLYKAFRFTDPDIAEQIYQEKLLPQYRNGIWDNNSAYYAQNLIWLGLLPPAAVPPSLLQPETAAQKP